MVNLIRFLLYTYLKVSTKYAIAERLGNFIDPMNLPEELLSLRQEFFMCTKTSGMLEAWTIDRPYAYTYYQTFCLDTSYPKKGCKVNFALCLDFKNDKCFFSTIYTIYIYVMTNIHI